VISSSNRMKESTEDISGVEIPFHVVSKHNNGFGIHAGRKVLANEFITEFLGQMTLVSEIPYWKMSPEQRSHVLLVPMKQNMDADWLCVDARSVGNNARFVRRSCSPNAFVRKWYQNDDGNAFRVALFSSVPIEENEEITIPFDFDWKDSSFALIPISCACNDSQRNCVVRQWLARRRGNVSRMLSSFKQQRGETTEDVIVDVEAEDDRSVLLKNMNAEDKKRKGALSPNNSPADSPNSVMKKRRKNMVPSPPSTPLLISPTHGEQKMGREERKIAMLMKSFQRLEHSMSRKRKKEQASKVIVNSSLATSNTNTTTTNTTNTTITIPTTTTTTTTSTTITNTTTEESSAANKTSSPSMVPDMSSNGERVFMASPMSIKSRGHRGGKRPKGMYSKNVIGSNQNDRSVLQPDSDAEETSMSIGTALSKDALDDYGKSSSRNGHGLESHGVILSSASTSKSSEVPKQESLKRRLEKTSETPHSQRISSLSSATSTKKYSSSKEIKSLLLGTDRSSASISFRDSNSQPSHQTSNEVCSHIEQSPLALSQHSSKFLGKKAWIQEFQGKKQEVLSSPVSSSDTSKLPVKKKMLEGFLSSTSFTSVPVASSPTTLVMTDTTTTSSISTISEGSVTIQENNEQQSQTEQKQSSLTTQPATLVSEHDCTPSHTYETSSFSIVPTEKQFQITPIASSINDKESSITVTNGGVMLPNSSDMKLEKNSTDGEDESLSIVKDVSEASRSSLSSVSTSNPLMQNAAPSSETAVICNGIEEASSDVGIDIQKNPCNLSDQYVCQPDKCSNVNDCASSKEFQGNVVENGNGDDQSQYLNGNHNSIDFGNESQQWLPFRTVKTDSASEEGSSEKERASECQESSANSSAVSLLQESLPAL